MMGSDVIDRIRAFNRFYTGRLGLLSRSYLGSGLGLAEVRILHELAQTEAGPWRARALVQALGMDEGQVSRILAGLERRGWLLRQVSGTDGRQRDLQLTAEGKALVQGLIGQSREAVAGVLSELPPGRQQALAEALSRAEALLQGGGAPVLRDLQPGDMGWIVERHGAHYAQSDGFDASFEALVAEITAAFLRKHDPARERGWIATRGGMPQDRLGSIFCVAETPEIAKLRLFYVDPAERGTGLAQQMIDACMDFARGAGYRSMRLWTHESHRAAGRLYARNGFALTETRPVRSFGQDMVEQSWQRAL